MKPSRTWIVSEIELYDRALRLLAQKNRSRWELSLLVEKRCTEKALVSSVLDKCVARGYLDDIKYAVHLARQRATGKKQGRRRVAQELKSRGIAPSIAEQALEQVFGSLDEDELLRQALGMKLKAKSGAWTRKQVKKIYDQLVRAGFNTDRILLEFRRHHISPREMDLNGEEGE